MKRIFAFVVFCLFSFQAKAQSGYEIKINLKECKDTLAYLTFYQFDKTYIKDTCTNIKNGKIVFKGKSKLDKGIYSLISQKKSIVFDFFVDDDSQHLEINSSTPDNYIKGLQAVNAPRENEFFDYVRYISSFNPEYEATLQKAKGKSKADSTAVMTAKRKEIEKQLNKYETDFLARNKGSYIADVVNLKMEKTLQDVPKTAKGRPDSTAVYKYYKKHYWDGVNFQDDGICRNPFFAPKLKSYFENVVVKHPDSASVEVDRIMSKAKEGSNLYKILLSHFAYNYETSKMMGFDKVFVYISDKYFKTGKAKGIYEDESVVESIIKRADKIRPLLLDAVAPDLYMIKASDREKVAKMGFENVKTSDEVTKLFYDHQQEINNLFLRMHSVPAEYMVLVFWDVDCSHCQAEMPKLLDAYHDLQKEGKDVKVFAVYNQYEMDKYLKYLDEKKMDWINVYDGIHYNNLSVKYDIYSTPVIYILDKNKVIKAKKIGAEQVKEVIGNLEKMRKENKA